VRIRVNSKIASVVVLAAGQGKRMRSTLPKVLHPVCGRPMILHVLDAVRAVAAERVIVVLGHGHEEVRPHLPTDVAVALQEQQLGTGHAVMAAAQQVLPGPMLVVPGDTPLLTGAALRALVDEHFRFQAAATVLTAEVEDPTGYGRVVRDADGTLERIVEDRDATVREAALREVNSSVYVLPAPEVLDILRSAGSDNVQREIYLTDVVAGLRAAGAPVAASKISDPALVVGVNSQEELAEAERLMAARKSRDGHAA
jgi:bifunctional UDP-N-acetylglucosamine pyrophosphorylase/glucosamine-1-phosphate N-acetyltransferase